MKTMKLTGSATARYALTSFSATTWASFRLSFCGASLSFVVTPLRGKLRKQAKGLVLKRLYSIDNLLRTDPWVKRFRTEQFSCHGGLATRWHIGRVGEGSHAFIPHQTRTFQLYLLQNSGQGLKAVRLGITFYTCYPSRLVVDPRDR